MVRLCAARGGVMARREGVNLIVGLGNPGERYRRTRHNAGWMAVDGLAESFLVRKYEVRYHGWFAACDDVWLLKPLTYVNNSGVAVAAAVDAADIALESMLVLVDDIHLPVGAIRMRPGGASGGHNGLQSIVETLGTEDFPRLRIGIGAPSDGQEQVQYVLCRFDEDEETVVNETLERAALAAQCWLDEGIEKAMSRFNTTAAEGGR